MASRMSMYSVASDMPGAPRGTGQQAAQVSTTTLLNSTHNIYVEGQAYHLDAGSRWVARDVSCPAWVLGSLGADSGIVLS